MMRGAPALMLLALIGVTGCGDEPRKARAAAEPPQIELRSAGDRHERLPYMGVACPKANGVRCDSVGLAVWVARPAKRLTAWIGGERLALKSPGKFVGGKGTGWEGYLQPAHLESGPLRVAATSGGRWLGDPPVYAIVRLSAEYADGSSAGRTLRIQLNPGWG